MVFSCAEEDVSGKVEVGLWGGRGGWMRLMGLEECWVGRVVREIRWSERAWIGRTRGDRPVMEMWSERGRTLCCDAWVEESWVDGAFRDEVVEAPHGTFPKAVRSSAGSKLRRYKQYFGPTKYNAYMIEASLVKV